jgi:ankyrin repeat protein
MRIDTTKAIIAGTVSVLFIGVAPSQSPAPVAAATFAITHVESDKKFRFGRFSEPYNKTAQYLEDVVTQRLQNNGLTRADSLKGPCCKVVVELLEMERNASVTKVEMDLAATVRVLDAGGRQVYSRGYRGAARTSASTFEHLVHHAADNLADNIAKDSDLIRVLSAPAAVGASATVGAPAQSPPVTTSDVTVTSDPSGADIEINGTFSGNTPSTLKLPPGEYRIVVTKKDYGSWERNLKVRLGAAISLNAELTPGQPASPEPAAQPVTAGPARRVKRPINAPPDNLIAAAGKGDLLRVKELLAAGSDVNAKTDNSTGMRIENARVAGMYEAVGGTALMAASQNGYLEVVQALLDAKADVNAKASNGATALMIASFRGHQDVVRALIDAKADVDAKLSGSATALLFAMGNSGSMEEWAAGKLDGYQANGLTALMLASLRGHVEAVRTLLDAKADVNAGAAQLSTALMMASQNGHLEVARILLEDGANVNAKTSNGTTALMLASFRGQQAVMRVLLDAKADANARTDLGFTPLITAAQNGHLAAVRALLDAQADVNARASSGVTALIWAAENGHLEVVRALLDAKADVNAKTNRGVTALKAASIGRHKEVVELLKSAGAAGR